MGISRRERNTKTPLAQPVTSLSYICIVNSGNVAPSVYLKAPLAAIAICWLLAGKYTYIKKALSPEETSARYTREMYDIADILKSQLLYPQFRDLILTKSIKAPEPTEIPAAIITGHSAPRCAARAYLPL
jgi:hypothetical protein